MNFNLIGAGLLLAAAVGLLLTHDHKTVLKERARVSVEATKRDDKAQTARRRIAAAPTSRVLDPWYRD